MAERLRDIQGSRSVAMLEVGCGIGTMIERMLERGLLTRATYTAVDLQPEYVAEAKTRLRRYAGTQGFETREAADGTFTLKRPGKEILVYLMAGDLFDTGGGEGPDQTDTEAYSKASPASGYPGDDEELHPLAGTRAYPGVRRGERRGDNEDGAMKTIRCYDLIVAHAFLDLVDLDSALHKLLTLVRPGGLSYFTLNFDGATIFEPQVDPALDQQIEELYHQTMDLRQPGSRPSRMSRTGRRLLVSLTRAGLTILHAGSSDWVIHPGPAGYSPDESYFLHFIIDTIRDALAGRPGLDQSSLGNWIAERHGQIERGELVYIAHQVDVLAEAPQEQNSLDP
jgi:SAM-dependent methyltransferase